MYSAKAIGSRFRRSTKRIARISSRLFFLSAHLILSASILYRWLSFRAVRGQELLILYPVIRLRPVGALRMCGASCVVLVQPRFILAYSFTIFWIVLVVIGLPFLLPGNRYPLSPGSWRRPQSQRRLFSTWQFLITFDCTTEGSLGLIILQTEHKTFGFQVV